MAKNTADLKPAPDKKNMIITHIRIPEEVRSEFIKLANRWNVPVSRIYRKAFDYYLQQFTK